MIPIDRFLVLSTILFSLGMYGVLARRSAVLILMSVELMLQAVSINFIAFAVYLFMVQLLGWLMREMRVSDAFAASLDADQDGEEGSFYVWRAGEIDAALGAASPTFKAAYDVSAHGNWEGRTVLRRVAPLGSADEEAELAASRAKLLRLRETRATTLGTVWVLDCRPGRYRLALAGKLAGGAAEAPVITIRGGGETSPPVGRFVALAHELDLRVHAWTIDEADKIGRLLALGVDGIMSDRPSVLKDMFVQRGLWVV